MVKFKKHYETGYAAEAQALAESIALKELQEKAAKADETEAPTEPATEAPTEPETEPEPEPEPEPWAPLNPKGMTVLTRFNPPEGYTRVKATKNSFAEFVLNYPLKEDGAQILLYNKKPANHQTSHLAVFDLPIENVDLQQCADSVMRFWAEYYWYHGKADQMKFYYTAGFVSEYKMWRDGYGVQYADNQRLFFLDANPVFDDGTGNLSVSNSSDGIHLHGYCYARWGEWIKEQTAQLNVV